MVPAGDQPQAIAEISRRVQAGDDHTVLLGATGTGKTATVAWIAEQLQRPLLVMLPNKTLAAQFANELREMLPNNAVEYFVSYYDYYQPEAYVPQTDTYIEKDSSINSEVERLRHSATNSLLTRRDTIVVSSVSCIYGLGTPQEYVDRMLKVKLGDTIERDKLLRKLVGMQYNRNDLAFTRGTFRVRGDTIEIIPMYEGDGSRKRVLMEHGFRLPSAIDNRPLTWEEFLDRIGQTIYLSATPGPYELQRVGGDVVEQVIRPTGLVDPEVVIKPTKGQIDDLLHEIRVRAERDERVLVTTLTKRMAEDLTDYLLENGVRARYLHSEVDTLRRIELLRELRAGEYDVLVGINLLREGLDLPEVSLVAILDADKEGFLRSGTSLIQTIGRAARNVDGTVLMYADSVTDSMKEAISETQRRRQIQLAYNTEHGIDPQTIRKKVTDILLSLRGEDQAPTTPKRERRRKVTHPEMPTAELERLIQGLEEEMHQAAKDRRFEYAARLRHAVQELRKELRQLREAGVA